MSEQLATSTVDLLRALTTDVGQETQAAGEGLILPHLLERLLACQSVLTLADDMVGLLPQHGREVAGATVLVIQSRVDGVVRAELELRREPESPFGERELVLVDLLRPKVVTWLARLGGTHRGTERPAITQRQFEILALVRCGMSNKEIARGLSISEATVRKHLENAFQRLGVVSRCAAVGAAFHAHTGSDDGHV